MSGRIKVTNLAEVLKGFDITDAKIDAAAMIATWQAALAIEGQAKINANTGAHAAGLPHIGPRTGEGPNIVTGNLVNNIRAERPIKGFKSYSAIVGSGAEYARAIELGNPVWKSGVKFPYMTPAANSLTKNGTLSRIFTGAFIKAVRG
jgi:hypothetical protein